MRRAGERCLPARPSAAGIVATTATGSRSCGGWRQRLIKLYRSIRTARAAGGSRIDEAGERARSVGLTAIALVEGRVGVPGTTRPAAKALISGCDTVLGTHRGPGGIDGFTLTRTVNERLYAVLFTIQDPLNDSATGVSPRPTATDSSRSARKLRNGRGPGRLRRRPETSAASRRRPAPYASVTAARSSPGPQAVPCRGPGRHVDPGRRGTRAARARAQPRRTLPLTNIRYLIPSVPTCQTAGQPIVRALERDDATVPRPARGHRTGGVRRRRQTSLRGRPESGLRGQ